MKVEKNPDANEIILRAETDEEQVALERLRAELAVANLDASFAPCAPDGHGAVAVTVRSLKPAPAPVPPRDEALERNEPPGPGPASDPVSECREAVKLLVLRALGGHDDVRVLLLEGIKDPRYYMCPTGRLARLAADAAYNLARVADLLHADMNRDAAGADFSDSIRASAETYLVPLLRTTLAACIAYLREFTGPGPTPEGVRALFPEAKT